MPEPPEGMVLTGNFCWKCDPATRPIGDMRRHFMSVHGLKKGEAMEPKPMYRKRPQFYCEDCGVSFISGASMKPHRC